MELVPPWRALNARLRFEMLCWKLQLNCGKELSGDTVCRLLLVAETWGGPLVPALLTLGCGTHHHHLVVAQPNCRASGLDCRKTASKAKNLVSVPISQKNSKAYKYLYKAWDILVLTWVSLMMWTLLLRVIQVVQTQQIKNIYILWNIRVSGFGWKLRALIVLRLVMKNKKL